MSDGGTSGYAPKSPDLSSFYSTPAAPATAVAPATPSQHQTPLSYENTNSNSNIWASNSNKSHYLQIPHAISTAAAANITTSTAGTTTVTTTATTYTSPSIYSPHSPQYTNWRPHHHPRSGSFDYQPPTSAYGQYYSPPKHQFIQPTYNYQPQAHVHPQPPLGRAHSHSHSQASTESYHQPSEDHTPTSSSPIMPPRRQAAAAAVVAVEATASSEASSAGSNGATPQVKTKFPTARIKRIMQADEEVGKVAQSTPIAVGKALELFMIQLVSKGADQAREKGSKRVTAQMLKHVIESDDQWDFLRDIASKVGEESEKKGRAAKSEQTDSDEEPPEGKRKGKGGRKRKTG